MRRKLQVAMTENIRAFTLDKMAREGLSKMMILKLSFKLKGCANPQKERRAFHKEGKCIKVLR